MNQVCQKTTTQLLESLHDLSDQVVWQVFDERYRPILFALARRLGLTEADAADVAQQTLTEFVGDYQSGRYDRQRGRLRSWLLGIARHRSIDLQRSQARRRELRGESGYLHLPAEDRLEEIWTAERDRWIVQQAMAELRAHSATTGTTLRAFEMVALQDLPPEQVARECGMTVDEVYRIKHRITKRLREITGKLRALYDGEV